MVLLLDVLPGLSLLLPEEEVDEALLLADTWLPLSASHLLFGAAAASLWVRLLLRLTACRDSGSAC